MTTTASLQYSHTLGFMANQGRGFNNPVDLAVNSRGVIYVLNRAGPEVGVRIAYKRITRCTPDEEYLGEFCTGGVGDGQLWWPSSLAFDAEDRLYVADEALNRISIFDQDGKYLDQWGIAGPGAGRFNRPSFIAFDQDGNLLVADSLNHRVQRYTREGRFLAQWGEYGSGNGQFNTPWGLAVDAAGAVYVSDWRNDRIQKFDAAGGFVASFGGPGQGNGEFHRPAGLAVDDQGNIIVADWGNEKVQVLDGEGNFVAAFRGESRDSLWAQDYFAANPDEANARRAAQLEPEIERRPEYDAHRGYEWERSANVEKLFWGPTSVKTGPDGLVYVVDSLRHRIQIYRQAR
jgi:DNA-binding beta-propeller fold protein YncE